MTDWSNHTTVEINRLLSLSEKELLARMIYLLDKVVENQKESLQLQRFILRDLNTIQKKK